MRGKKPLQETACTGIQYFTVVSSEVRHSFITTSRSPRLRLFWNNAPGHTTRAPQVGFVLATNGIQFYAIATWTRHPLHWWHDYSTKGAQPLCRSGRERVRQGSEQSQARRWADGGGFLRASSVVVEHQAAAAGGRAGPGTRAPWASGPFGHSSCRTHTQQLPHTHTAAAASTRATRGRSGRPCESPRVTPSHS